MKSTDCFSPSATLTLALLLTQSGCGSDADVATHGFEPSSSKNGCPSAILVTTSDYVSTNVSVLGPDGEELTDSFISSNSAPPGLTTALSGDIGFPSSPAPSGKVVLIDRYPNSVLSWVDAATGEVERQMAVGNGFASNPQDYLELSPQLGLVSRYEQNPEPGRKKFDVGSDVLQIDPSQGTITGSLDLRAADDGDFLPRPDRLLAMGDEVWVMLQGFSADFSQVRESRLVSFNPKSLELNWTLPLSGYQNCGGLALSPSKRVLALSCTGLLGLELAPTKQSDVLLLDVTKSPPVLVDHFNAARELGAPLTSSLAFVSELRLVGTTFGDGADRGDFAYTLDTETRELSMLVQARSSFVLGGLLCAPGCEQSLCFLADAADNALDVWEIGEAGELTAKDSVKTGLSVKLPPRSLGAL